MGYGQHIDRVAGTLSHLLHVRPARHNTVADLERHYLDLPPERMFPEPPPLEQPRIERGLVDRMLGARTLRWPSGHEVLCPRYRRRHERDYKLNLTARARWVRPDRGRRDECLVYVHGWLEPGSWAEESTLFRKWARELDVDLAHVALPFHGSRKPRSALFSGEFFWTADLVRSIEGVRQAVWDVRALVGWLRRQGYRRVGVTGLSLGGSITMLLACLEPLPDFIVPIIGHLRLEEAVEEAPILWRMRYDLEKWGIDRARRTELFRRIGWSSYEPKLPADRQLWIEARDDMYINARRAEEQWEAWSRPPILWIDSGHMTFPLHIDAITRRMHEFIRQTR